jgi:FAD/FMN-containing dehydrogenase
MLYEPPLLLNESRGTDQSRTHQSGHNAGSRHQALPVGKGSRMSKTAEDAVRALANRLRGDIVQPGNSDYDAARSVWTGSVDRRPSLIVRCTSAADVRAAQAFAREQDLAVAVHSGGHSFAGHGTVDGGIVIDLYSWTEQFWKAVQPYASGVYVNFLADEGTARIREAYRPAAYARLEALRGRYDPDNVFRLNQNIAPAVGTRDQEAREGRVA